MSTCRKAPEYMAPWLDGLVHWDPDAKVYTDTTCAPVVMALELGLRWLHDRARECVVCNLSFKASDMRRFGGDTSLRPQLGHPVCWACLEETANAHGAGLE